MAGDFEQDVFQFYQQCYQAELERKEKLLARVNLAAGLVTILGGVLAYYAKSIDVSPCCWIHLAFYIPLAVGCLGTLFSMILLAISIAKGFGYAYIPKTTDVAQFLEAAAAFNKTAAADQKIDPQQAFLQNLSKQYCEYAAIN
jgi:hypothetical protein